MKEALRVFSGNKDTWTRYFDDQKQNADKFVDETIESIVAHATQIRKLQEQNKKKEHKTTTVKTNRHLTFPDSKCIKQDEKKSFQLQNFNLAPAFVIRKRKLDDGAGPTNYEERLPGVERREVNEGQDSLNHIDPVDDIPVRFPPKKYAANITTKPIVSPIPDFIAKDFPLDFTQHLTPMKVARPITAGTGLANKTSELHYESKRDSYESCLLNADVEEPPVRDERRNEQVSSTEPKGTTTTISSSDK